MLNAPDDVIHCVPPLDALVVYVPAYVALVLLGLVTLVIDVLQLLLLYHVAEPVFLYTAVVPPLPPRVVLFKVILLQFALHVYDDAPLLFALPPFVYPVEHVLIAHLLVTVFAVHVASAHVLAPLTLEQLVSQLVLPVPLVVFPS